MKKILSLLLVVAMVLAIVACGGLGGTKTTEPAKGTQGTTEGTTATTGSTVEVNPGFNADDVVFTFGAISDIHLEKNSSYGTEQKFVNALNQLLAFTDERGGFLNAVAIVGDVCETKEQISTFKSLYEGLNMPGELIFGLGNHDQESYYSKQALKLQDFKDVLGDKYFNNEYNDLTAGNRHFEIDGQHFIYVQPQSYGSADGDRVTFSDATVTWLDTTLKEITDANPNAYVYVLTHSMIKDTSYGSDLRVNAIYGGPDGDGSYWYTSDLTATLNKYPQVITFSGHLHFPINDERSIMQNTFTSIGTGSVAYLAMEGGFANANGTVPTGAGNTSSGHIVEIDSKGNVRVTRLNFSTGKQMGDAWVLTAPTADGEHLKAYAADRADKNKAPSMADAKAEVALVQIGGSGYGANLSFTAGTDDSFVHHYKVKFTNTTDNTVVKDIKLLTDFWENTDPADMAKSYAYGLGSVASGKSYKVEVIAVDSWGAESAAVTATFTVSATFDGTINATDVLVDVDFADGAATDSKGNATVTLVGGATVASKDVTHGGVTKPLAGLQVTAEGQSGTITLTNYDLDAMKGLYNGAKGFSFEAFYINRVKSGTQGIVCATEFGGLGMADSNGGVPGLCSYYANSKYDYTRGSAVASATELVHVITTAVIYEGNLYTSVYVNGELTQSKSIASTGYWMTDSRYAPYANQLSLGNDIGANGFPTSDFTMVDAKVYSVALNPEQVKTAYNAAKALFN